MNESIHPLFADRPNDDAKLWRYLSFASFTSLLQTSFQHFTRVDKFGDHFEGVWPRTDLEYFNKLEGFNIPFFTEQMRRTAVAASCWNELPHESAAMWGLYAPGSQSVAISTTFGKLNTAVNAGVGSESISDVVGLSGVGRVQYIDHTNVGLIGGLGPDDRLPNTYAPFMLKNVSYEHEKEVRSLLIAKHGRAEILEGGCDIPVDNKTFIDEIVISPFSQRWFSRTVLELADQYDLREKIKPSSLSSEMFYQEVSQH